MTYRPLVRVQGRFAIEDSFDTRSFKIHLRFQTTQDALAKPDPTVREFSIDIPWEKLEPIKETFEFIFTEHNKREIT